MRVGARSLSVGPCTLRTLLGNLLPYLTYALWIPFVPRLPFIRSALSLNQSKCYLGMQRQPHGRASHWTAAGFRGGFLMLFEASCVRHIRRGPPDCCGRARAVGCGRARAARCGWPHAVGHARSMPFVGTSYGPSHSSIACGHISCPCASRRLALLSTVILAFDGRNRSCCR